MFLRGVLFLSAISLATCSIAVDDDASFVQTNQVVHQSAVAKDEGGFHLELGKPCTLGTLFTSAIGSYCLIEGEGYEAVNDRLKEGTYYEPLTHQTIESYLKDNNVVGDILHGGTYVGDYLPHLSAIAPPGTRVYGFEPDNDNYDLTAGTIGASGLTNVWMMKAGVGNDTQLMEASVSVGGKEIVMIRRLDEVFPIERKVAAIHLDVEGFELDALHGSLEIINRWHPLIVVEVHYGQGDLEQGTDPEQVQTDKEIYALMESLGYSVYLELPLEWNVFFEWKDPSA